jgi:hypothetical protein
MFIKEYTVDNWYVRHSKFGIKHTYNRKKRMVLMRCDNCNNEFIRDRGKMNPKRLSNNYFHVCENCDAKKFAQRKGIERKRVWQLNASSDLPIGKL